VPHQLPLPGVFDDLVDVTCSIGSIKRSSFRVEFEMHVGSRLVADGYGVGVGFDYTAQHASPLPGPPRGREPPRRRRRDPPGRKQL
jgi:acyl-CoA thioesterase FadM